MRDAPGLWLFLDLPRARAVRRRSAYLHARGDASTRCERESTVQGDRLALSETAPARRAYVTRRREPVHARALAKTRGAAGRDEGCHDARFALCVATSSCWRSALRSARAMRRT